MTSFEVKAGTVGLSGGVFEQPRTFTPFVPASRPTLESSIPMGASVQSTLSAAAPSFQSGAMATQQTIHQQQQSSAMGDSSQKSTRICRHFQRGRCTWGEHCRFVHELLPTEPAAFPEPSWHHSNTNSTTNYPHAAGGDTQTVKPISDRALTIGVQQSRLQTMRHAKLNAALTGTYETFASDSPGHVTITIAGHEPDTVAFLSESQMQAELQRIEKDERFQAGGLMFLAGEPSVFYTAVRMFNTQGTCGSKKLDFLLHMAQLHNLVECMFYTSPAGCQAQNCCYEHRSLYHAAQEGTLGKPVPEGLTPLKLPAPCAISPPGGLLQSTSAGSVHQPTSFTLGAAMTPAVKVPTVSPKLSYGLSPNASVTSNPSGAVSKPTSYEDVSLLSSLHESPALQDRKPASTSDLSQWDSVVQTLQKQQQPKPSVTLLPAAIGTTTASAAEPPSNPFSGWSTTAENGQDGKAIW